MARPSPRSAASRNKDPDAATWQALRDRGGHTIGSKRQHRPGRPRDSRTLDTTPRTHWGWLALLAVVVVAPYLNSLDNPFIWDDSNAIVNNPTIQSLGRCG